MKNQTNWLGAIIMREYADVIPIGEGRRRSEKERAEEAEIREKRREKEKEREERKKNNDDILRKYGLRRGDRNGNPGPYSGK